jgi:hypothetical protein
MYDRSSGFLKLLEVRFKPLGNLGNLPLRHLEILEAF